MASKARLTIGQILKNPSYHLVPGHLYTNTWKGRRISHLQRLEQALYEWGMRNVSIREFGPGGIAAQFADRMPCFDEEDEEAKRKNWSKILNFRETRARNRPDSILTCFEPQEIYEILGRRIGISKLEVVDKYQKVLEGVAQLNLPDVETRLHDMDMQGPYQLPEVDVVIAFNVATYASNQSAIYNSVRNGGLLAMNLPSDAAPQIPGFTMLREKGVYLRGERPDKMRKVISWQRPRLDEETILAKSRGDGRPYAHKI